MEWTCGDYWRAKFVPLSQWRNTHQNSWRKPASCQGKNKLMSTIEKVENHSPILPQIPNELFQLARATLGQANPLVAAMCYPHCPQIARLYLDGVQPAKVYDPIVHGLTDYITGKMFRQVMEEYGLPQLLPTIRSYFTFIMSCRSVGEPLGMEAELALQYRSKSDAESVLGMGIQLEKFGGSWVNLQSYVRSWSVLMQTWKAQMKIPGDGSVKREFCKFEVLTSVVLNQKKWQLLVPVWGWKVTKGMDKRIYLGLLTTRSQGLDALRFGLVANGVLRGEEPDTRPDIYGLDRDTGAAYPLALPIERDQVSTLVSKLYTAACATPNMPLGALRGMTICSSCGYWASCFGDKNRVFQSAIRDQSTEDSTRDWTFKSRSSLADAKDDEEYEDE
jgi:hypothetical protein